VKEITIILTVHYKEEVNRLCNRVIIIDHGMIIALDTPSNLKDGIVGDVVTIKSTDTAAILEALKEHRINRVDTH